MESKIKIAGHPVHPMLIAYPVAFYTAALVCFIVYHCNTNVFWFKVAIVANIAGVILALVAAIPGFVDWLGISKIRKAKKVGLNHMICNVLALIFFAINAWLQYPKWNEATPDESPAIILTAIGMILTLIAGFLGWSLIQKHHIGVSLTVEQEHLEPADGVK
jgi:uncharacterized membrane protein